MGTGAAVGIIACGVIGLTGAVVRRYEGGGWRSAFALFVVLGSFFLLGAGWSGLRGARVRDSPLARFVGHTVTVEGSLADDPKPGPLGWTATMQVKLLVPPSSVSSVAIFARLAAWSSLSTTPIAATHGSPIRSPSRPGRRLPQMPACATIASSRATRMHAESTSDTSGRPPRV